MNENKRQLSLDDKIDIFLFGSLMLALAFTSCKGYQVIKRQQHYLDRNGITNYSRQMSTETNPFFHTSADSFYSREYKTIGEIRPNATLTAKGVPEIDKITPDSFYVEVRK